ncbi:CST complex subunit CTC1 [Rutidosis leptorrhynchoides]|uniref:CST complex subunit CTC1 n=1 Tax=Rutidosis leptorrhynchoides TaxID=125765 RepID=UPI003A99CC53
MEEDTSVNLISISDLLHRLRPLTGASSLSVNPPIHAPTKNNTQPSDSQNPNSNNILKPLDNHPTLLIGTLTLTLPSFSCHNSSCLKFSDHSGAVCCDILKFDLRIIGRRIRVLAWNFVPAKPHGGLLEIIRWSIDQSEQISVPNFNAFYLNSVIPVYEKGIVPHRLIYGLLESISPVANVPCTSNKNGTKSLDGFLAEITVCECEICSCRDKVISFQDIIGADHKFSKTITLYFCGPASIWYPVISRLVGGVLLISGMKKKMVFLGEEKSLMMYVTAEKSVIHIPTSTGKNGVNARKGLCNVYTGCITATYMQGMVIELDQNVLLLLTDNHLSMPHSLRTGAIITLRNFHVEDPKFAWTKVKILGSCYRTSIRVNVFSPTESRCYQVLQSRSLLRKFIESLTFSSRLWVLLVVSSFRKKFAGILTDMEILGSKHLEGLVQKYSSSCLPLSLFRFRHGVLSEYCLHESSGCGKKIDYHPSKLVVPISNFISRCEGMFLKGLFKSETDYETDVSYSSLFCGGKSYDQPISKILKSDDMNVVLLGNLKISEYSGKLQLVDATGSIDIVIPDLSSVWSIKDIYEMNDFTVVMEGYPRQLEQLESLDNEPFSCGNIFNHFNITGTKRISLYVHCYMKDAKLRNRILCPSKDTKENFNELESGRFHLLLLVHKFPLQQKFPGDNVLLNSVYAEARVLPWYLILHSKMRDLIESSVVLHEFKVANMEEDSSCSKSARKLLLEFKSDSICKYESMRIGGYYLLKHHDKDPICTAKDCKAFVNPQTHFWNVSFSVEPTCPITARTIDGCREICPDIHLRLSADYSHFLGLKLRELKQDLIKPTKSIKGLLDSYKSPRTMMDASTSSGTFGANNLPVGSLLSVQGHVVAVHEAHGAHHRIGPGLTNNMCIHVLVDEKDLVKIYSSLSEHSYPIGFGPGIKASFYRVLLSVEGDVLKLTAASFIEINSIVVDDNKRSNEWDLASVKSVVETDSLSTGPATLISEIMQFSDHKQLRLHCKVVAIYVLVLEKNRKLVHSFSTDNSESTSLKIPLAGFIMDDGSSSCCCWTDNERAVALFSLRLRRSLNKSNKKTDDVSHINKILDQHGTIVMKNNGSMTDSSCLDVALSTNSDNVVSGSDEQFLKSIVLQACSSNTWNIVGTVLNSNDMNQLAVDRLQRLDMTLLPLQNIWASEVSHLDTLNEGRNILQELLKSQ